MTENPVREVECSAERKIGARTARADISEFQEKTKGKAKGADFLCRGASCHTQQVSDYLLRIMGGRRVTVCLTKCCHCQAAARVKIAESREASVHLGSESGKVLCVARVCSYQ